MITHFVLFFSIAQSLSKFAQQSSIDEGSFAALLGEIRKALLNADVHNALIDKLETNIRKSVGLDNLASGVFYFICYKITTYIIHMKRIKHIHLKTIKITKE